MSRRSTTPHDEKCAVVYDGPDWHEDVARCARCQEIAEQDREDAEALEASQERERAHEAWLGHCDDLYDQMKDDRMERP